MSGLWSVGHFFHCLVVGFEPLQGPDRGSFFHYVVMGFQPLVGTCSIFFAQLLDSKCTYVLGSVCMLYLNITLALHIHSHDNPREMDGLHYITIISSFSFLGPEVVQFPRSHYDSKA